MLFCHLLQFWDKMRCYLGKNYKDNKCLLLDIHVLFYSTCVSWNLKSVFPNKMPDLCRIVTESTAPCILWSIFSSNTIVLCPPASSWNTSHFSSCYWLEIKAKTPHLCIKQNPKLLSFTSCWRGSSASLWTNYFYFSQSSCNPGF